jgi:predicted enzyme involved in methoxymalonyl-ACP biosynthesis
MDQLRELCTSDAHDVLVARLADRFGSYGTIGLAVIANAGADPGADAVLELLLMSCRVMSRGVGAAWLGHIVREAVGNGRRPVARFVRTPVNRVMLVTLRFAGFELIERDGDQMLLAFDPRRPLPSRPSHVRIIDGGSR